MSKDKTPRNTKSWKTEAKMLEVLLVRACALLGAAEAGGGAAFSRDLELSGWWDAHQDSADIRQAKLKESGLAKLSDDERAALGLKP